MATFEQQVEALTGLDITGSSSPTQTELSSFLVDGVFDVVNKVIEIRPEEINKFTTTNSSTSSQEVTGKIISVMREHDSTSILRRCTPIDPSLRYEATDTDSLHYRSKYNPAFYEKDGQIHTVPAAGSGNNDVVVTQVTYDTGLVYSDTYNAGDIANFPKDYEYLVALYASIQSLHAKISSNIISIVAVPPDAPTISAQEGSITGTAPIYTSPTTTISGVAWATEYPTQASAITTALSAISTEIGLAKGEVAEIATQTDNTGDFETALDAMKAELDKVDDIILLAHEEFDEVAAEVSSTATSPITQARAAVPSAIAISDLSISATAPVAPSLSTISYTDATNADATNSLIGAITVATVAKADISAHVPEYTKPVMSRVSFSDYTTGLNEVDPGTDIGITATLPVAPSISAQTVASFGTAPTYNKPSVVRIPFNGFTSGLSETDPGIFSINAVAPVIPALSSTSVSFSETAPTYTKQVVAPDFATVNTYIDTNEDIELAGIKLQEISQQLNEYQSNIQQEVNKFNKENSVYQAQLQISIQNAQIDNQEDARLLDKYQAEVATYQADINKEVQVYSQKLSQYQLELNTSFQAWSKAESDALQQYSMDMQNELNEFNKENVEYQSSIQDKIQEAQLADSHEAKKLQKYQNELSSYQAEVSKQVQDYQSKLSQYQIELDTRQQTWSKTESDTLQEYSANIQNELNSFNKQNAKYQANVQAELAKHNTDLQKALTQAQIDAQDAQQEASQANDINKFNKAQDQALDLQNKASTMQAAIANNQDLISKFSSELQSYTASINKEVQEYQQNINQRVQEVESSIKIQNSYYQEAQARVNAGNAFLQQAQATISQATGYAAEANARGAFTSAKFQAVQGYINTAQGYASEVTSRLSNTTAKVSEYQVRLQDALNTFNDANVEYQAQLQVDIQRAQLSDANEARKLQKYMNEVQGYQAEVNKELQENANQMQQYQSLQNQLQVKYDSAFMVKQPQRNEKGEQ